MKPEHDIARLPKWAQSEIRRLRADVDFLTRKLKVGPEDSNTFADPYASYARRPLGKGPTIEFQLRDGSIRARVEHDPNDVPYLDVNGSNNLAVFPWAANALRIRVERF